MTVETRNASAGWFTEVNDVGTRYSAFEVQAGDGRACWDSDLSAGSPGAGLYVDVADDHATALGSSVPVTVTYLDEGDGRIALQYDGRGEGATWGGSIGLADSGDWETHTFTLPAARLRDDLGAGHDFRLLFDGGTADVCVGSNAVGTESVPPLAASSASAGTGDGTAAGTDADTAAEGSSDSPGDAGDSSGDTGDPPDDTDDHGDDTGDPPDVGDGDSHERSPTPGSTGTDRRGTASEAGTASGAGRGFGPAGAVVALLSIAASRRLRR